MKKLPEIIPKDQMVPPQNAEDNILYIGHYGFNTKLKPAVVRFHPDFNKHELYSFEIRTTACHTHISSHYYEAKEYVSEEVFNWMEENIVAGGDSDYAIRQWNEPLWFDKEGELAAGFKISCPGTCGPEYEEPWINIYDGIHIEGKDFSIEILEITENKHKIKLKITGNSEWYPILFIGWFTMEYIDPNISVDNFFKDLKDDGKELTRLKEIHEKFGNFYENFPDKVYEYFFRRILIEKSPYWKRNNENYEEYYRECIVGIANKHGFNAKLEPQERGELQWVFKLKSS